MALDTNSRLINGNDGIVVEGTAVAGGYFVTQSIDVTDKGEAGKIPDYACVTGALCYVTGTAEAPINKFYQYNGTSWVEKIFGITEVASETAAGLMSAADKIKLNNIDSGANQTTVDNALSSTSENPVQNKVVTEAIASKLEAPTGGSEGQVLKKTANGVEWANDNNTEYSIPTPTGSGNAITDISINGNTISVSKSATFVELENGKIPSSLLPSYVSDIVNGYYKDQLFYEDSTFSKAIDGQSDKIYVDLDTNKTYRWGGDDSNFVEISASLALGYTAETAAPGNHTHNATVPGHIHKFTPQGSVTSEFAGIAHSHTYTPEGTISTPTFTGTLGNTSDGTVTVNSTFTGSEGQTGKALSGDHTYTLEASPQDTNNTDSRKLTVSADTTSTSYTSSGTELRGETQSSTDKVTGYLITDKITYPTITHSPASLASEITNKCMKLTFTSDSVELNDGEIPITAAEVELSIANHTHAFTMEAHGHTVNINEITSITVTDPGHSHSYTPAGSITISNLEHSHTFTPEGSISNNVNAHTHTYTPQGSVSAPEFTGISGNTSEFTAGGNVDSTFTGIESTINTADITITVQTAQQAEEN